MNKDIRATLEDLKIPEYELYSTHSFRIGFITRLLKKSLPIDQVGKLVGHKSISATVLYNRFSPTSKEVFSWLDEADDEVDEN